MTVHAIVPYYLVGVVEELEESAVVLQGEEGTVLVMLCEEHQPVVMICGALIVTRVVDAMPEVSHLFQVDSVCQCDGERTSRCLPKACSEREREEKR